MNQTQLQELIQALPKSDLHVHLDGSIRLQTIIDLAKEHNLDLPTYTVDGLNEQVFKEKYESLEEYLKTFGYSCSVMQTPESLERISYEFAQDNQQEGVRYVEVRFAPQLHMGPHMDMRTVLSSVNRGLAKAQQEFNAQPDVQSGKAPEFHYGIIVCALRAFGPYSPYYQNFINAHPYSEPNHIHSMGSLELVQGAVKIRDTEGIPIVGFDLAGAEAGNPAKEHAEAFKYAHDHFLFKTVHAGEAYGASSIFQAITDLHTERIGHGYYVFDESKVDESIDNPSEYIQKLTEYIAERRITIEVCLTSNLQTNPSIQSLKEHSFKKMLDKKMCACICTDNRTVSKTSVTRETMLALQNFEINPRLLKSLAIYGFKSGFFPGSYVQKRDYIRHCIDYYESLVEGTPLDPKSENPTHPITVQS